MSKRNKLLEVANELRGIASKLYHLALHGAPGAASADELTIAALVLWRRADELEELIAPPQRAPRSWCSRQLGRLAAALKAADA